MKIGRLLGGLSLLAILAGCTQTRLETHRAYLVGDQPARPSAGVRVTYLGTAGCLLESSDATVLVDPYFTRMRLGAVIGNAPVKSDQARMEWALKHLPNRAAHPDLILVTHGHVDHALDAVKIARESSAQLVASPSTCFIAQADGLAPARTHPMPPGTTRRFGPVRVTAYHSAHPEILGHVPMSGIETRKPPPPQRPGDWKVGEPLSFLIEMGGKRIYHGSGAATADVPTNIGRIDLAMLGGATKDDAKSLAESLRKLVPRHFFPFHQDNFFRPLDEGFSYLPIAKFETAKQAWEQTGETSKLILLDYFHPWTLR